MMAPPSVIPLHFVKTINHYALIIDREAREIIRLVASVRVFACVFMLRKNTMTHEIQSKNSVCLSVIKERSRSKSCAQRLGAFTLAKGFHFLRVILFDYLPL